jgi:hypothetical protein
VQRHPFDPVSAALGVLTVGLGGLVATRSLGDFDVNGGWWLAAAAVVVGLAIIPWRRRSSPDGRLDLVVADGDSAVVAVRSSATPVGPVPPAETGAVGEDPDDTAP